MDFEWLSCVDIDSSIITNVSLCWGNSDNGGHYVWDGGTGHMGSLYTVFLSLL